MSKKHASANCEYTEAGESSLVYDVSKKNVTSSLASDFLFDECPDMSKKPLLCVPRIYGGWCKPAVSTM